METTLGELKAMLLEKCPTRAEDPMEHKLRTVELLCDSSIMEVDDAQTVGATGLLDAEAITAIYKRNEVEAATKKTSVHENSFI